MSDINDGVNQDPLSPNKNSNVSYSCSPGLAQFLIRSKASLVFTSYQSGLLYLVGVGSKGQINVHQVSLPKPMGIRVDQDGSFVVAARAQLFRFQNILGPKELANQQFDACFLPRQVHFTGALDAHDVGFEADGGLVFVNTRFNCLARTDTRHSFSPVWCPPFISELVDEDRCHLNGLAMRDGKPAFVTSVSRSNTIDGWRDRRANGGVVTDVASDSVVCHGLSMPHSPRWHNDQLWILNSGTGELGTVDPLGKDGFRPIAFCPGFVRGLGFLGRHAVVGLSKPRYERFAGLDLDRRLADADSEPWCGLQIVDTATGNCAEWLRIDGGVGEIYDVDVLPSVRCPMAVSPGSLEAASTITFAPISRSMLSPGQSDHAEADGCNSGPDSAGVEGRAKSPLLVLPHKNQVRRQRREVIPGHAEGEYSRDIALNIS